MNISYDDILVSFLFFVFGSFLYYLGFRREITEVLNRFLYKKQVYKAVIKNAEVDFILNNHCPYYKKLNDAGKDRFIRRTREFIKKVHFYGKDGLEVTSLHEVLIAASSVQLTFGLDRFLQHSIGKIFIYPDSFFSSIINNWVNGLAMGSDKLLLSWKAFEEGLKNPSDKRNLGLHEMAHALKLSSAETSYDFDIHFSFHLKHWNLFCDACMQEGRSHIREYGLTNPHEFFSSSVEYFFEAPEEMKLKMPKTFYLLCLMLNQNPLNTSNNYRVDFNVNEALANLDVIIFKSITRIFTLIYYIPILFGWFITFIVFIIGIFNTGYLYFYPILIPSLLVGGMLSTFIAIFYDEFHWDITRKLKFTLYAVCPIVAFVIDYYWV